MEHLQRTYPRPILDFARFGQALTDQAVEALMKETTMLTSKMITRAAATKGAIIDFSGDWKSELGSIMTLAMAGQQVSGTYESVVSGGGGSVKGDLVGFTDGDLISFVVNWTTPASLTAWTGQLTDVGGEETIRTTWLLVQNMDDASEPSGLWKSTLVGSDEFRRV